MSVLKDGTRENLECFSFICCLVHHPTVMNRGTPHQRSTRYACTPCYPTVSLLCDPSDVRWQLKETTFSFHFINSFEEDGHVIVDATHYPTYPFGRIVDQKPPGFEVYEPDIDMGPRSLNHLECLSCRHDFFLRLRRTTLSPDGGVETREMTTHAMEFASVNPHNVGRRQRFTYMVTLMYPDAHTATQVLGKVRPPLRASHR